MSKSFVKLLERNLPKVKIKNLETIVPDVGEYDVSSAIATIDAKDVEQVIDILKLAVEYDGDINLYPFSTGRNWGLGSGKAPYSSAILLSLKGLNKIREINISQGYAVIEPGVTQGLLSENLRNTYRYINVTASSAETSFLGNALDRGVGLRHQRTEDLLGLEIVLPNGSLQRVGWWPEKGKQSAPYSHGIGPSLVQFFCQSNFAVVTGGVIRLLNRPEKSRVAYITFPSDKLNAAVTVFQRWAEQGLIRGVLKIYDETATLTYGAKKAEFLAHLPVSGAVSLVSALSYAIEQEFNNSQEVLSSFFWSDDAANPYQEDIVANVVASAYQGDTRYNDALLKKTLGTSPEQVDSHGNGWLFFLPLVPFSGKAIEQAYSHILEIFHLTGVKCGATINALNDHVIDLVVSIRFDRTPEDITKAHTALALLHEKFDASGFYPYRLDIAHPFTALSKGRKLHEIDFIRNLKKFIDPRGILAQGKYF